MFQPQVTGSSSAAHYSGMVGVFDKHRRKETKGNIEEVRTKHTSILGRFIRFLASKGKGSPAADVTAKTA